MSKREIRKVGVIGTGTMGSGIAQLISSSGLYVTLIDISDELIDNALKKIDKTLQRAVEKERISDSAKHDILARISTSTDYSILGDSDLVIEAVVEDMNVKKKVFKKIEENTDNDVIIATNTSTLPVIELSMSTSRPENILGIHFFNPAPVMKLVEIVKTLKTSGDAVRTAEEFARSLDKEPVITRDRPGFIVNRILFPMINEAVCALEEGLGTAEEIDKAMKLGTNQPIGPLALADLVGLDVSLDVLNVLHQESGDPKYRPALLLKELVRAGHLGRKSGRGFFNYS